MAVSCLYVAGKVEDNHLRLRALINVAHTTLRRDEDPMELNDEYYATREAIVQAELFLLRMVNFQTNFDHPHKYLLHYLKSLKVQLWTKCCCCSIFSINVMFFSFFLQEWMSDDVWEKYPIAKTSWSLLQDFYHDSSVVSLNKSLISLACIQLALQSYGIAVPYQGQKSWHFVCVYFLNYFYMFLKTIILQVFNETATDETLWEVMTKIMEVYTQDVGQIAPLLSSPSIASK
jgi:hypothetical protein